MWTRISRSFRSVVIAPVRALARWLARIRPSRSLIRVLTPLRRHRKDVVLLLVALLVAYVIDERIAGRQEQLTETLAQDAEITENLRFVRQVLVGNGSLKPLSGLDLTGTTLARLPLGCTNLEASQGCADFSDADLEQADFTGADIRGADFQRSLLFDTKFSGADLTRANLTGAYLIGTRFYTANLHSVDFQDSLMDGTSFRDSDLTEANFLGRALEGVVLYGADLRGARLTRKLLQDGTTCFDSSTIWPTGLDPPEPADGSECSGIF